MCLAARATPHGAPVNDPPSWNFLVLIRLLLLFTVVPMTELVILLWLADRTAWWFTLGLVVFTGILGAALARSQGFRCLREIQEQTARGELPARSLVDGLMILIAGAVLITPGILTDVVGFSLLIPPIRSLIRRWLMHRFRGRFTVHSGPSVWQVDTGPPETARDEEVIDAEFRDLDDTPN